MALRARIYAYNRHLSFDVAFICSTLTHCGVCDLSAWRLKWEVSYVHQRVWRWKWFSCQLSYVLQRLWLCRASDTVFRREIDSQRQWGYGTCYGDSFPAAKECRQNIWHNIKSLLFKEPSGIINWVCYPINTDTNPKGRLTWPSAITRLTAHFTCGQCLAGDLQTEKRVWLYMTPNVLDETRCH